MFNLSEIIYFVSLYAEDVYSLYAEDIHSLYAEDVFFLYAEAVYSLYAEDIYFLYAEDVYFLYGDSLYTENVYIQYAEDVIFCMQTMSALCMLDMSTFYLPTLYAIVAVVQLSHCTFFRNESSLKDFMIVPLAIMQVRV